MADSEHHDMIEIIYDTVLSEMELEKIPDTIPNRIACLEGLRDAWKETAGNVEEARPWITTVEIELIRLYLKQIRDHIS